MSKQFGSTRKQDGYSPLGEYYHWLVSDEILSGEAIEQRYALALGKAPPHASILDCACGIGSDAIALARRGFKVTALDGSEALIAQARCTAISFGITVPFAVCLWNVLATYHAAERFDLVLWSGNSIAHCLSVESRRQALRAIRQITSEDGFLFVDTRNWTKLFKERPRLSIPPQTVTGKESRVFQYIYGTTRKVKMGFVRSNYCSSCSRMVS